MLARDISGPRRTPGRQHAPRIGAAGESERQEADGARLLRGGEREAGPVPAAGGLTSY